MTGRRRIHPAALAGLALVVVGIGADLPGCASGSRSTNAGAPISAPAGGPALGRLRRLALREAEHPETSVMAAPPPPGLESLIAGGGDDPDAGLRRVASLPELLRQLAQPIEAPPPPDKSPTAADLTRALRLYASGRERLLRGDAPGGVADLTHAAELDPSSGEVWLALGDAQAATGARAESLASIDRGTRLGSGGARPWEVLGRAALGAGDHARAAALLARAALQPEGSGTDAALQSLIGIELGQALDGLGYAKAAADSLAASLKLLDTVQGTQRYRAEIAAIARRRGELWVRVGDLACRAGDYGRAAAAYETAWGLAGPGPAREGLTERRVFAGLRTGRARGAAEIVYELIAGRDGWVADPDLALCGYLRSSGGDEAPAELSEALDEYARAREPGATPALAGRITLARAALLPARQAAQVLEEHLGLHPADQAGAAALLGLAGDSPGAAVSAALRLAELSPLRTESYARVLLGMAPVRELLAALDTSGDRPAADLLAGRLLGAADATDDALARLDQAELESSPGSSLRLGVQLAAAEIAGAGGRWPRLERAVNELNGDWPGLDEGSVLWARAGSLAAAQRFAGAVDALRRLADAPAPEATEEARVEHLLAAGELGSRLSLGSEAERWMRQSAELDPFDERVHARLIGLYAPGGAMADATRFGEALRGLRQNCPEGRMVRKLRAQDMIRRGAPEEALRQVLALVREDPTDGEALDMLADAWERRAARTGGVGAPADVEGYLRGRVERAPDDAAMVQTLARVLAGSGRADEAESLLRASLAVAPQRNISRTLEGLLRQTPSRADEANGMALTRLGLAEGSPSRPRSITETIEAAELLQHLGRDAEAVAALRAGIPAGAVLTPNQAQVLIDVAGRATGGGGNAPDPEALAFLDACVDLGVRLTQELHGRRIILLLSDPRTPVDRLMDGAGRMVADYPDLGIRPYQVLLRDLVASESPEGTPGLPARGRALAFAEAAATSRSDPEVMADWLRLIAASGDAADARRLAEAALHAGIEGEVLRRVEGAVNPPAAPAPPPPTGTQGAAEIAQLIGDFAAVLGRDDVSAEMYRLSLSYDPAHAWAANNLGYHLAETARRPDGSIDTAALEESERLLSLAAGALPNDGSVLDSLGWLRYRRGILQDQKDAAGKVVVEGAVSLLRRAVGTSKGVDNQTILDHLGDALWLAGQHDLAAGAWATSEQAARQRMEILRASAVPRRALEELSDILGRVSGKLAAVRAGAPPRSAGLFQRRK